MKKRFRDWDQKRPWRVPFKKGINVEEPKARDSIRAFWTNDTLKQEVWLSMLSPRFDIEAQIFNTLSKEITKQIDEEIIGTMKLAEIMGWSKHLEQMKQPDLYDISGTPVPEAVYNGPLNLMGHVAHAQFCHKLTLRQHLGGRLNKFSVDRLRSFRPVGSWSHYIDVKGNDIFFYFTNDDDRVNFLLLI